MRILKLRELLIFFKAAGKFQQVYLFPMVQIPIYSKSWMTSNSPNFIFISGASKLALWKQPVPMHLFFFPQNIIHPLKVFPKQPSKTNRFFFHDQGNIQRSSRYFNIAKAISFESIQLCAPIWHSKSRTVFQLFIIGIDGLFGYNTFLSLYETKRYASRPFGRSWKSPNLPMAVLLEEIVWKSVYLENAPLPISSNKIT